MIVNTTHQILVPTTKPLIKTGPVMASVPDFDSLTLDPKGPVGNAWGLFPRNDIGMLNLLTPENIRQAASEEIRTGVRISLDLALDRLNHPSYGRKPFTREMVNKAPRIVNDDILMFNTQTSSQWDGFRHYGMFVCGRFGVFLVWWGCLG